MGRRSDSEKLAPPAMPSTAPPSTLAGSRRLPCSQMRPQNAKRTVRTIRVAPTAVRANRIDTRQVLQVLSHLHPHRQRCLVHGHRVVRKRASGRRRIRRTVCRAATTVSWASRVSGSFAVSSRGVTIERMPTTFRFSVGCDERSARSVGASGMVKRRILEPHVRTASVASIGPQSSSHGCETLRLHRNGQRECPWHATRRRHFLTPPLDRLGCLYSCKRPAR